MLKITATDFIVTQIYYAEVLPCSHSFIAAFIRGRSIGSLNEMLMFCLLRETGAGSFTLMDGVSFPDNGDLIMRPRTINLSGGGVGASFNLRNGVDVDVTLRDTTQYGDSVKQENTFVLPLLF